MTLRATVRNVFLLLASIAGLVAPALGADEPASSLRAAERLIQSTVTIRISTEGADDAGVTVCSGVSIGEGRIVTFHWATAADRFRVTLANGDQAEARLGAIDEYSGLCLLEVDLVLERIDPTAELPPIGGSVVTAAAAGIEPPVVSSGILSAIDRGIGGSGLPPLLQCDLRTTETSPGGGVVDRQGRLIGVIAAMEASGDRAGWTYAVPADHVLRLLRAVGGNADGENHRGGRAAVVVVLKRRRPVVGLTMTSGESEGTVEVERVEPDGPAAEAGIEVGDVVLEADGRRIRSAYQAVDLVLKKQPGDTMRFIVSDQRGGSRSVEVTLGGGEEMAASRTATAGGVDVGAQLNVQKDPDKLTLRNRSQRREIVAEAGASTTEGRAETETVEDTLARYGRMIAELQREVRRRDELDAQTRRELESLRQELAELKARNQEGR